MMPYALYLLAAVTALFLAASACASTQTTVIDGHTIVQSATGNGNSNIVNFDGDVVTTSAAPAKTAHGPIKTIHQDLNLFAVVDISVPVDATFTVSPHSAITITGPADALASLWTRSEDGALTMSIKKSMRLAHPLRVEITGPGLNGVAMRGTGTFKLAVDSAHPMKLIIEGAGTIKASGSATTLGISTTGAGNVDALAMKATDVTVSISGSGDVRAWATGTAKVEVEGSGTVTFKRNPA